MIFSSLISDQIILDRFCRHPLTEKNRSKWDRDDPRKSFGPGKLFSVPGVKTCSGLQIGNKFRMFYGRNRRPPNPPDNRKSKLPPPPPARDRTFVAETTKFFFFRNVTRWRNEFIVPGEVLSPAFISICSQLCLDGLQMDSSSFASGVL